jgi:hypothetical protein
MPGPLTRIKLLLTAMYASLLSSISLLCFFRSLPWQLCYKGSALHFATCFLVSPSLVFGRRRTKERMKRKKIKPVEPNSTQIKRRNKRAARSGIRDQCLQWPFLFPFPVFFPRFRVRFKVSLETRSIVDIEERRPVRATTLGLWTRPNQREPHRRGPHTGKLPEEVWLIIMGYPDFRDLCRVEKVSQKFCYLSKNPSLKWVMIFSGEVHVFVLGTLKWSLHLRFWTRSRPSAAVTCEEICHLSRTIPSSTRHLIWRP